MKILIISLFLIIQVFADFKEGEKVFKNKCASCHIGYISLNKIKENFFEKNNEILNLKAPTVNMLVYAIMDSSKKIGDPDDIEMQELEIEMFLKSYLENPDRFNSICDDHILDFYDGKESMKGQISDEEYKNLTTFFMEYKNNYKEEDNSKPIFSSNEELKILDNAKKENKKIIVYATSKSCYFCKKMQREVLNLEEIKKEINQNYIFLKIDMDESTLPFDLQKKYKKITPTFFIVDSTGNYEKQYPGAWVKKDFLEILNENIK